MRHVNIIGVGFVPGVPGQYANCTVWLDDDNALVGVTPLGQALEASPVEEPIPSSAEPEPAPEPVAPTVVEESASISLHIGS